MARQHASQSGESSSPGLTNISRPSSQYCNTLYGKTYIKKNPGHWMASSYSMLVLFVNLPPHLNMPRSKSSPIMRIFYFFLQHVTSCSCWCWNPAVWTCPTACCWSPSCRSLSAVSCCASLPRSSAHPPSQPATRVVFTYRLLLDNYLYFC